MKEAAEYFAQAISKDLGCPVRITEMPAEDDYKTDFTFFLVKDRILGPEPKDVGVSLSVGRMTVTVCFDRKQPEDAVAIARLALQMWGKDEDTNYHE